MIFNALVMLKLLSLSLPSHRFCSMIHRSLCAALSLLASSTKHNAQHEQIICGGVGGELQLDNSAVNDFFLHDDASMIQVKHMF